MALAAQADGKRHRIARIASLSTVAERGSHIVDFIICKRLVASPVGASNESCVRALVGARFRKRDPEGSNGRPTMRTKSSNRLLILVEHLYQSLVMSPHTCGVSASARAGRQTSAGVGIWLPSHLLALVDRIVFVPCKP